MKQAMRYALVSVITAISLLVAPLSLARTATCPLGESVAVKNLPRQGQETLALIAAGGPFASDRDGITFNNRERILPKEKRGYYREYTVRTPGVKHRGARRIVCGGDPRSVDQCYYSDDHYQSFKCIAR
jgi:ribonuclease T1